MAVTDTGLEVLVFDQEDPAGDPLAHMTLATAKQLLRQLNETGRGEVTVHSDDPSVPSLKHGNLVKLIAGGEAVKGFIIENTSVVEVSEGEEADRLHTVSGRGVESVLDHAVLYPEKGLESTGEKRVFTYASALYDDSSWGQAIKVQEQGDDVPELLRPWSGWPTQWPDKRAEWLWDRVSTNIDPAPVGDVYFRATLHLQHQANLFFYTAADDLFEMWLNGERVIEGTSWRRPYGLALTLQPGAHQLAAKGTNRTRVYDMSQDSDLTDEVAAETAMNSGEALLDVGIIDGTESGDLDISGTITRGAMAKITANTADFLDDGIADNVSVLPDPGVDQFTDISDSSFRVWINRLGAASIVEGFGDGTFQPTINIERRTLALWLWKVLDFYDKAPELDFSSTYFTDVPQGSLYAEYIYALANEFIFMGYGEGLFGPEDDATRGQAFNLVKRTLERVLFDQAGPAGYIASIYDETGAVARVIMRTTSAWKALGYPAQAPAMTPGEVLRHIVSEAAARGVAYMAHLTLDFTDDLDSAGQPWEVLVNLEFDVGESLLSMCQKLVEMGVDLEVTADLEIRCWNRRGEDRTTGDAPLTFRPAQNLVESERSIDGVPTNTMLVRGAAQLQERDEPTSLLDNPRRETYLALEDAMSETQVSETVTTALGLTTKSQTANSLNVVPTPNHAPLDDYDVGDWGRLYHTDGTWETVRVTSIAAEEQETGLLAFSTEVSPDVPAALALAGASARRSAAPTSLTTTGRARGVKEPEERVETWLGVAAKGTLRGDLASASSRTPRGQWAPLAGTAAGTTGGKGFMRHGADPTLPRPTGFASIEWIGTVRPNNMVNLIDTWVLEVPVEG